MELRQLRYFVAVAEELHFTRAAKRSYVTEPPLSQQIRRLEAELGVRLFNRTKRSVQLTDAGQAFLQEVRPVLAQADEAVRAAQRGSRGEVGRLVVGFVNSAIYDRLPVVLRSFRERFPSVELDLRELSTAEQEEALLRSEIRVGILRQPVDNPVLAVETIFQEPLVVALPETHPLAAHAEVAVHRLAGEAFVMFPRRLVPAFYDRMISLCHDNGFSLRVVQEATQMQTILSLVAAGLGVSLISSSCQALCRSGVAYRSLTPAGLTAEVGVAWRRGDESPVLGAFLTTARRVAREAGTLTPVENTRVRS